MTEITFWFDPVSPYAHLAFERLPQALVGCSYSVRYRPVLLVPLLRHWGHKGPAEITPKREWTYRQVDWLARTHGVALQLPTPHPFNPLALLRLSLACVPAGQLPNRRIVEAVMRHAWEGGGDPNEPVRLQALQARLAPVRDPQSDEVKAELKAHTDKAIARGLFGVPMFELAGGRLFWGFDALPMLAEAVATIEA